MNSMLSTPAQGPRRILLALVLGLIGAVLVVGGGRLLMLGGSAYYLLAGLAVVIAAALAARGDRRAIWVYLAMLVATVAWAVWEGGLDPWRLQSRLIAPAVLGLWVAWPLLRARRMLVLGGLAAVVAAGALWLQGANRTAAPAASGTAPAAVAAANPADGEWQHYGRDRGGSRYAPLDQITPANVGQLEQAWVYRTGVAKGIGFETTPLMVDGLVYLCTQTNIVVALDPDTGARRWQFDPHVNPPPSATCRGVSYYKVPEATGLCATRILTATTDARLLALDAQTGALCPDFGDKGTVDLRRGMGEVKSGYYYVSSAPAIVRGKAVVGGWVADGQHVGEPSGVIRAFDAVTGQFAWAWDMDKPDFHGEPPEGQTYSRGTANSWGPMSADEQLGMVYLPTGNSTPDYWGAHRSPGSEKYSASVVALDAETGGVRWHYQYIHHDVWDYDVSAQPTLIDLPINGETVPALLQGSKRGLLLLFDRRDGKLLSRVVERPVPQGPAKGDWLAPTQPFSTEMPTFDSTLLTEQHMWGLTPLDQLWCRIKFREARYEGPFTPPGARPSITYPSYLGGINWGGVSVDPVRRLAVVNWSRMANYTRMVPREDPVARSVKPTDNGSVHVGEPVPQMGTPFALFTGPFLSPIDVPCTQPPFGKIGVVDLDSRKMVWEKPLGTGADSGPLGYPARLPIPMGVPNAGGTSVTKAGLIFVAATQERAIRAFDIKTGAMLWHARLPAGGHASPAIYRSPKTGRDYVVIAAGGNASLHSGASDHVIAYALPKP